MANIESDTDGYAGGAARGAPVSRAANLVGAMMSVALVVGLAVWGYKLAVRDASGVPVVRALEGPTRVQPENPGGDSAEYQGLAVNSVQAEGEAETPADRLTLAPKPITLTDEDQPVASLRPVARSPIPEPAAEGADAAQTPVAEVVQPTLLTPKQDIALDQAEANDPVAAALALAAEVSDGVSALTPEAEESDSATLTEETAPEPQAEVVLAGLVRSPRPKSRPDIDLTARAVAAAVATAASPDSVIAATPDVVPDAIPVGSRLAQLGAFDSPEIARAEWDRLSGRFGAYLNGKSRVIQEAQSGGRTFYRLRAMGFEDINDARRFCSALLAENAACIPVVTR